MSVHTSARSDMAPGLPYDRRRLEDIGYMTCMTLTLLGNYAQTGHFGGPLAYTPFNVAAHLAGPELGGLRYDYRRPKHPYGDKFMLAAGHCAPTCYALWMILGAGAVPEASRDAAIRRYHVAPDVAMLPVDALGFRRGAGALKTLLADQGLSDHPLFAQAKGRGIRALSGHIESTDRHQRRQRRPLGRRSRDGGGKGRVLGHHGRSHGDAEGHRARGRVRHDRGTRPGAQDPGHRAAGRQATPDLPLRQQRRHRRFADRRRGGTRKFAGYRLVDQWTSYGWNVLTTAGWSRLRPDRGRAPRPWRTWDPADRRPMIVIGTTTKGYWPGAVNGKIPGAGDQVVGYPSHPYGMKMNSEYFVALARTFEARYGVEFQGISQGPVTDPRERLIQFKTNIDVVMSVLERDGLGDWLADRLVEIGDSVPAEIPLRIDVKHDPFLDDRLRVANLPEEPQTLTVRNSVSGEEKQLKIALFRKAGEPAGARRAVSEIVKWAEPRHRQPRADPGRRPLGIDQPRARQHLGPLRSRDQPAGDAAQGRDPGSGQRVERHRPGRPERVPEPRPVRRSVGVQRHLRRLHAADVPARPRLEPAEPGQQVPHRRPAHPRRALRPGDRRRRAHPLRDLRSRRCGSCSRAIRSST